jgi:hypothetical protein
VTTADLAPVSTLTAAETAAARAARALLPLVAATVRHQFPDAAFLVLTREYDEDEVEFDSVRTADGTTVWSFAWDHTGYQPFPKPVPAELAALWGGDDPQNPGPVQDLVQRIDRFARIGFLDPSAMRKGEANADRTPLGIPLAPPEPKRCAVCLMTLEEHAGRICPRP